MQLVHVYVNFPGTTREAFEFYETVFETSKRLATPHLCQTYPTR